MTYARVAALIALAAAVASVAVLTIARFVPTVPRYDSPLSAMVSTGLCPGMVLLPANFEAADEFMAAGGCVGFATPSEGQRCDRMQAALTSMALMAMALESDPDPTPFHHRALTAAATLRPMVEGLQARECGPPPERGSENPV